MEAPGRCVPRHPIRVAASRAGLTPTLLRAWERRYGVVEPGRTDGGRRLYSDDDVRRLRLLKQVVAAGRNIGQVVELSMEGLEALAAEDRGGNEPGRGGVVAPCRDPEGLLERTLEAVSAMEGDALEGLLTRGTMSFGAAVVVEDVVGPLLREIGRLWQEGNLSPRHEHLGTVVIRRFLDRLITTMEGGRVAPVVVVGTPRGHVHELGAFLVAAVAAVEGWRVVFLGSDLPWGEIEEAARLKGADAVALSAIHDGSAGGLLEEVESLRRALDSTVILAVGGTATVGLEEDLVRVGVRHFVDLGSFRSALRTRHPCERGW